MEGDSRDTSETVKVRRMSRQRTFVLGLELVDEHALALEASR